LVNNYAASKVKEFIARCKGSESYTKNENTSTVVTQNPAETSKKGTGFSSRKGLGCISSSKNSACAESADLKVQLALKKAIQKRRRESDAIPAVEEEACSEEESKTTYQKKRRAKKNIQLKMIPSNMSIQNNVNHAEPQSALKLLDPEKQQRNNGNSELASGNLRKKRRRKNSVKGS
jgi:hypothetical protein